MPRENNQPSIFLPVAAFTCGLGLIATFKLFPDYYKIGFVITSLATTSVVMRGFDHRVTRFDFLPFFEMSYKAVPMSAAMVGGWILLGGLFTGDATAVVGAMFGAFFAMLLAIPCCAIYVAIRKRIRPIIVDTFVRCPLCEYRVDNLRGPRCPECGTVFDGRYELES